MPKNRHSGLNSSPGCSVEATLSLIDGKWKCVILFYLLKNTLRFNELRRLIPDLSPRMLTTQLRELEADGLIVRKIYPQVPPKVEYSMAPLGLSLTTVLAALKDWGDAHLEIFNNN